MQGCVLSSNDNINHIWLGRWNIHARPSPHFLNNEELCSTLLFPTTHRCVCSIAHKAILINPSRSFIRFSYTDSQNLILRIITLCPFFWFLVVLFELLCFHWSCITSCFCLHSLVSSPLHIYRNSVLQSIQPEIKRAEEIWPLMQSLLNAYVVAVTLSPPRLTHTAQKHRWLRSNLRDNMINRFTLSKATCPGHRWRADVSGPWCCLHSLSPSQTHRHTHTQSASTVQTCRQRWLDDGGFLSAPTAAPITLSYMTHSSQGCFSFFTKLISWETDTASPLFHLIFHVSTLSTCLLFILCPHSTSLLSHFPLFPG